MSTIHYDSGSVVERGVRAVGVLSKALMQGVGNVARKIIDGVYVENKHRRSNLFVTLAFTTGLALLSHYALDQYRNQMSIVPQFPTDINGLEINGFDPLYPGYLTEARAEVCNVDPFDWAGNMDIVPSTGGEPPDDELDAIATVTVPPVEVIEEVQQADVVITDDVEPEVTMTSAVSEQTPDYETGGLPKYELVGQEEYSPDNWNFLLIPSGFENYQEAELEQIKVYLKEAFKGLPVGFTILTNDPGNRIVQGNVMNVDGGEIAAQNLTNDIYSSTGYLFNTVSFVVNTDRFGGGGTRTHVVVSSEDKPITTAGTLIHEMGHTFGLWDLYRTPYAIDVANSPQLFIPGVTNNDPITRIVLASYGKGAPSAYVTGFTCGGQQVYAYGSPFNTMAGMITDEVLTEMYNSGTLNRVFDEFQIEYMRTLLTQFYAYGQNPK